MRANEVETKEKGKYWREKISYNSDLLLPLRDQEFTGYTWISRVKNFGLPAIIFFLEHSLGY